MKHSSTAILAAFILLLSGSAVAHAEENSDHGDTPSHGPAVNAAVRVDGHVPGIMGMRASTSVGVWERSPDGPRMASSSKGEQEREMHPAMRAIVGVVTDINSSSFTFATRMNDATTTFTANVSDSTTFKNGTTTGSFSDLEVGSHIVIEGKVSTSTASVDATTVVIGQGRLMEAIKNHPNFFANLKAFFMDKHESGDMGSTTHDSGDGNGSEHHGFNFGAMVSAFAHFFHK